MALLAGYLAGLPVDDLRAAARFFAGDPLGDRQRRLAVGGRTLIAAAQATWDFAPEMLRASYRASGDLATALAHFIRPPLDLGLFAGPLTPASYLRLLDEIAQATGTGASRRRTVLCQRILGACDQEIEARYVLKILTGELRIGLRDGFVVDALAAAFACAPDAVRHAQMAAGDIGRVAVAARDRTLATIEVRYGGAVGFMLATPLAFAGPLRELAGATWIVEDKYDGIRAQAHRHGTTTRLFADARRDRSGVSRGGRRAERLHWRCDPRW